MINIKKEQIHFDFDPTGAPVINLHETAYIISNGEVVDEIPVDCRGKLR
jgi:hypothetical protein